MKKTLFILAVLTGTMAAPAMELQLSRGSLPGMMDAVAASDDDTLVLTGEATAADLTVLRSIPAHVTSIDMSGLSVKACTLSVAHLGQTSFSNGEIPAFMLFDTRVKSVTLPAETVAIGDGAFSNTPIEKINLGNVALLGEAVFHNCGQLRSVDMSESRIAELPRRTFSGCEALEEVALPTGLKSIGARAFYGTGLRSINLPEVEEIGIYGFAMCRRLGEISFPNGCRMSEGVFYGDEALDVISGLPGSIPALYATHSPVSTHEDIHGPIVSEGAFNGSSISNIVMKQDVVKIEHHAFGNMQRLESVSVRELGGGVPETNRNAFRGVDTSKVTLYVAEGSEDVWKAAPVWSEFNIHSVSGIANIEASAAEITITRDADRIYVTADEMLTEVSIFTSAGAVVATYAPARSDWQMDMPEVADVVIVRAAAGNRVKIVKLMGKN